MDEQRLVTKVIKKLLQTQRWLREAYYIPRKWTSRIPAHQDIGAWLLANKSIPDMPTHATAQSNMKHILGKKRAARTIQAALADRRNSRSRQPHSAAQKKQKESPK